MNNDDCLWYWKPSDNTNETHGPFHDADEAEADCRLHYKVGDVPRIFPGMLLDRLPDGHASDVASSEIWRLHAYSLYDSDMAWAPGYGTKEGIEEAEKSFARMYESWWRENMRGKVIRRYEESAGRTDDLEATSRAAYGKGLWEE